MNRWITTCVTAACLGASLASAPASAGDRRTLPVPAWSTFDGKRWGDLVLGETTRAAFDEKYASSRTERNEVLQATTPGGSTTRVFVIFNGPGREAGLVWIVCFYEDPRRAPQPAELMGRAEWREFEGYALTRRAGWRIFAAPEQGFVVVAERRKASYGVAGLIMGAPERVTDVVGRLKPAAPGPPSLDDAPAPLQVPVGEPQVDVHVTPTVQVDGARLQREATQAVENRMRERPVLRVTEGSEGRLAVMLEVEPRQPGDKGRITLTTRVSLDAESGETAVHARSPVDRRTLDAASSDRRIQEEARRMIERGIDAVAASAADQLQRYQTAQTNTAQREVRPALFDFLVGAVR